MLNLSLQLPEKPDKQHSQFYWILTRKIPRTSYGYGIHVTCECLVSLHENLNLYASLLIELNSRDCFNSDLKIMQKDTLDIIIASETFRFEMRNEGWQCLQKPHVNQSTFCFNGN